MKTELTLGTIFAILLVVTYLGEGWMKRLEVGYEATHKAIELCKGEVEEYKTKLPHDMVECYNGHIYEIHRGEG